MVGVFFVVLTILIIWQTFELIGIIKIMGQRMVKEQQRLRVLMIIFSVSYVGTSGFYFFQAAEDLHCTDANSCVRFNNLMSSCVVQFCFDQIPIGVLYLQHYWTSMESL